jgi:type IV pilus assembly protein PilC
LLPALELIAHSHARPRVARVIAAVARDVVGGTQLSAALGRHPKSFDRLYCQMISLGEASGSLATILTRLADDRERSAAQKAKLRAALTYPIGVLLLALAITAALLIWVVPTFAQIFDGVGAVLPAPTRFVLALSSMVAQAALPVGLALTAIVLVVQTGVRRSPSWRLWIDRALLKPPLVGPLLRQLCVARWSRALGTLLAAGTPLADVFGTLAQATGNAVFDRATAEIGASRRRGERLASAMRSAGCFPADVIQLIAVAEETGALDTMLVDLATLNDKQVDERIAALSGLAEPLIIVLLGALVGGLVIAMYLPIIQLGNVV